MKTTEIIFPVILTYKKDGKVIVDIPDFNTGLQVDSYNEAMGAAGDIICMELMDALAYGREIPEPSPEEDLSLLPYKQRAAHNVRLQKIYYISFDLEELREEAASQEPLNSSFMVWVPERISKAAKKNGIDLDDVLVEALSRYFPDPHAPREVSPDVINRNDTDASGRVNTYTYPAVILPDKEKKLITLYSPDLDVHAGADSLDNAYPMLEEKMAYKLIELEKSGTVPVASDRDTVGKGKFETFLVRVPMRSYRGKLGLAEPGSQEIVTIPCWMQDAAIDAGLDLTDLLVDAVEAKLAEE